MTSPRSCDDRGGGRPCESALSSSGLEAGETVRISVSVARHPALFGDGEVIIWLDNASPPPGHVDESNESDNRFTRNATW